MKSLALLIFLPFCGIAFADDGVDFQRRVNNSFDVFAECAAFYNISAVGLLNSHDSEGSESAQRSAGIALAVLLSGVGKETALSKLELSLDSLSTRVENDFTHFSRLLTIYAKPCGRLIQSVIDTSSTLQ